MRIIVFILSLLISVLALMPCSDISTCDVHPSEETHSAKSTHNHSEDKEDTCSPFCTCACCGCVALVVTIPSTTCMEAPGIVMAPLTATFYQSNFVSAYFYSFWQPPKISIS